MLSRLRRWKIFQRSWGEYVLFCAVFFRLLLLPSPAIAVITPAGQIIRSQSTATYDTGTSQLVALSNEIVFAVLPVYGPVLLPDGTVAVPASIARAFTGESVTFPFTLTNTGNDDDTYSLSPVVMPPSDFIPQGTAVYLDVDGDSLIDPGEVEVTQVGPLASGEVVALILSASLPGGLTGGEAAHLDLVARSLGDTSAVDAGNVVRIVARDEARVALTLESDISTVLPGGNVTYTMRFSNTGERAATAITVSDYIDYAGMTTGTEYVAGSVGSSLPGTIEYFDIASSQWVGTEPPPDRVKGVRLGLASLLPAEQGTLSFIVQVNDDHAYGNIFNTASTDYTGGDAVPYSLSSNEVIVLVGRLSDLAIGPRGDPDAVSGSAADCVVLGLNSSDTTYTFWHEILNDGNYLDTLEVVLADSVIVPPGWVAVFVDSNGTPLGPPGYRAPAGDLDIGDTKVVGLRINASPDEFRSFAGREFPFDVEAQSLIDSGSSDRVRDVFVKADIPLLSVIQSIREPTALTGDILSFIVTVENLTEGTTVDSVLLVENLSPGLGFAGGSDTPEISGNVLRWRLGTLQPGEKREVVFRARVKAGQEWGRLISDAYVYGITALNEQASDGPATASVQIVEGIFTRRGTITGMVFHDTDGNGLRDPTEIGVSGASVFIEDGTYAVTDSAGFYSIPGVQEGLHVVRVDPASLPYSLVPGRAHYFGLGVKGELLIDLAPSGNRRADFPLESIAPQAVADTTAPPDTIPAEQPDTLLVVEAPDTVDLAVAAPLPEMPVASASYEALKIPSTQFAPGSVYLEDIPLKEVAALSLWIREHPGWRIEIEGHSDNVPISTVDFPSNFELSLARARAVYQLLLMNGIDADKIDYTGYGDRMPVASNDTPEGRAENRRVEVRVVPPEGYAEGNPELPEQLSAPDTTVFRLADDSGICAEIVKPDEGHVFRDRDQIDVEVLAPLTSQIELYVDNIPVGREKIGQKQIDIGNRTIAFTFYGVRIRPGPNELLVVCKQHGGEQTTCLRHVYLAGQPAGIIAEMQKVSVPADGKISPELVFLVSDENGLPVRDGIFAEVEGPGDLLEGLDANPHRNGVQVPTRAGRIDLSLAPMRDMRIERIYVSIEDLRSSCTVIYESPLRDWFIFGFGDGRLGYGQMSGTGTTHRSKDRYYDGAFAEGKLSFYGQGEVGEGHMLTAAIDTRPMREDKLFDRIEPEKYYPIYGDASELKFNASSRSGTYIRMDHRRYNAMLGDFKTDFSGTEFSSYYRSFNGVDGQVRFDRGSVKGFITNTDQLTLQEEIRAEGTSGFYFLSRYPVVEGSEKVRIEVRDRYQPEKILRTNDKQINRDYDINYLDGSILFKEPIPAYDKDFNPVRIIVSYECRNAENYNFTYGARGKVDLTDSLSFGATAVLEDQGTEMSSLVGIDLMGPLYREIGIESEFAYSDNILLGIGNAFRLKLKGHHDRAVKWSAYYRNIDPNFFNPSFTGGKTELGSRKFGADLDWDVSEGFSFAAKGYSHRFQERDQRRAYADLLGIYRAGSIKGQIGLAGASDSDVNEGKHSGLLMLTRIAGERGKLSGELLWDQILAGDEVQQYPNRLQAALMYRFWKAVKAGLKHEYRTGSRYGTRHLTQFEIESRLNEHLNVFSRYRLEGAMSGERGQASVGLNNRFRLGEDLTATFSIEKLATVSGWAQDDFLAIAGGALYTPQDKDYRLKGTYETRFESERTRHLAELAGIKKLGEKWSGLLKTDLWFSDEKVEMNRVKGSVKLGFAFRPRTGGRLSLLSLIEGVYEKNSPAHPGAVDRELMASIEANYPIGLVWELEGKVAGRFVQNFFRAYEARASTFMYQTQLVRVIGERWDIGFKARIVQQTETHTIRYGGGLELGRLMAENVWLGLGYDFGGNEDGDAPVNDFSNSGFYVRLRLKFDERLMKHFY
jgi:uncharacterized repeat protein (TIGR01451 family)